MVEPSTGTENLLRELAPQVLGAFVRRYGHFDACEDAVQEALLAAALQWPGEGVPDSPRGWLIRVASRRLTDQLRSEQARRRREETAATQILSEQFLAPAADAGRGAARDDTLILLFLCCHPALTPASQIALTLRAVGGLSTDEIARAFLVPEPTMSQRILRAKRQIEASGVPLRLPPEQERVARLRAVLQVLYLIFTEGHAATSGAALQRLELTGEAIRLTRLVHRRLADDGEVAGLLALMLLTDARRAARSGPDGEAVPLAEQDRSRWDQEAIAEGVALVTDAMSRTALGPYQLQAAIAAVHAEATRAEDTDWPQILGLYGLLERSPTTRSSPSTTRSPRRWCRAPAPGSPCWSPWTQTPGWRYTTAWTRSGRTCWRWPATGRLPSPSTGRPRAARAAPPRGAISRREPPG
ncbi:sigma factor-like helix-turn-helix DNA-binding protein [soil metagenome]